MTTSFQLSEEQLNEFESVNKGTMSVSQFAKAGFLEKINRMQKRDDRARRENLSRDIEAMKPVIEQVLKQLGVL